MKKAIFAVIFAVVSMTSSTSFAEMVKVADNANGHWKIHPIFVKNPEVKVDYDAENIVKSVNSEINKVQYVSDIDNYGTDDYWATPEEFFKNGGDCEDFAIAKYFALKSAGISEKDMKIVIMQRTTDGMMHAVLFVDHSGKQYVLDNNTDSVKMPKNYKVIYAVNKTGLWKSM